MSKMARCWMAAALVAFAVLLFAGSLFAGVVTQHYDFAEPVVKEIGEYHRVTMEGAWHYGDPPGDIGQTQEFMRYVLKQAGLLM